MNHHFQSPTWAWEMESESLENKTDSRGLDDMKICANNWGHLNVVFTIWCIIHDIYQYMKVWNISLFLNCKEKVLLWRITSFECHGLVFEMIILVCLVLSSWRQMADDFCRQLYWWSTKSSGRPGCWYHRAPCWKWMRATVFSTWMRCLSIFMF